uniref:FYVE-type domain-containing protein n=1 Tax=Hyaloperonospora arabidopsidis (strain Emoy2) TaxID=559515 RepID=M4BJM8_HYAAE
MELDDSSIATPRDSLASDVNSARLRHYHQACAVKLETTLQLLRECQERDRRSRQRASRNPLSSRDLGRPEGLQLTGRGLFPARGARQWKLLRESSDIQVYRLKATRRHERTSTVQAVGTVHGSLHDVMNGLYADSTRTARVLEMLLSPRSLDARVLHVDKSSTDSKPFQFSGIVWMAQKLPGLGLCRHRDFVCFKKMDLIKDDVGEEMGYLVLHSIDPLANDHATSTVNARALTGATWPPRYQTQCSSSSSSMKSGRSNDVVRGFISLAIVFKRLADDRVAMFAHGQFNSSGRLPPILGDHCIAEWLTSMANTVQSGQAKNLSVLLANQRQGISDHVSSRERCGVCARALFFWNAPRNCRGCWKPCCRTCRVTKPIFCAHSHPNGISTTGGPCTETFCLACVCEVIPSVATINARLLKRLAKKRKRVPTFFRPTITASSITDGSIPRHQYESVAASEQAERLLAAAEISSISALSSRESEKHQQHRLSVSTRPKKRASVQSLEVADQEEPNGKSGVLDVASMMLEVLEHYQVRRVSTTSVTSGMSSSNAGISLRSFTSADLSSTSTNYFTSLQLGRFPSGNSLLTHDQSFRQHIPTFTTTRHAQVPLECRRSTTVQAQSSFWLPRQSTLVKKAKESSSPALDEEYYQRLLQTYLRHTYSSRSLAGALSHSSFGGKPMVIP